MKNSNFFRLLLSCLGLIIINMTKAQYIRVDKSLTDQQLVDKFIGSQNSSCITADNVKVLGQNFGNTDLSHGYFYRNGSSFEMEEGIILSTGKVSLAPGPNNNLQSEYYNGWDGDQDLMEMLMTAGMNTDDVRNATSLEFDFTSNQSDVISFDYMFLSEEYRASNCYYSDVFAFLIKKADNTEYYRNIALVPGTKIPVTSTTISGADCTGQDGHPQYFGRYNGTNSPTNFNGQTKVLKAITNVEKGVKYHIKLVIADHGDRNGIYDSAVFLRSGSFTGNIDIGKDLTNGNSDPLCKDVPYRIQPNPPISDTSAQYTWFRDGLPIAGIPTSQGYYDIINEEGIFSVNVLLASGCAFTGNVRVEKAPVAQITTTPIVVCDDDFNGSHSARLAKFDNEIIQGYDSSIFTRTYSLTPGGTTIDPNSDFVFTSNPQTLYLSIRSKTCTPDTYPIQFVFGTKLSFNAVQEVDICDIDINGNQDFNLADYISLITNEAGITPTYFATEAQAKAGGNSTVSSSQTINADKSIFIRIEKDEFCPNYKEIKFKFKQPKKSTLLPDDPIIICKGKTIELDAGTGYDPSTNMSFSSYQWYKVTEPSIILSRNSKSGNLFPGDYIVELGYNGCIYKQSVKIKEAEEPVINNVLIEGTTTTVLVSGGTLPYRFALDNGAYQSSNIFTNVELGTHTVYVQGADGCSVIAQDFTLINSQNIITPNNDGVNDVINYSSLLQKLEPKFEIYDRFGVQVFKGDVNNQFIWNGTFNGRPLPTSSYWYILEWNESGNPQRTQLSGWILLKNRN